MAANMFLGKLFRHLQKNIRRPGLLMGKLWALLRGSLYSVFYRLLSGGRVVIRFPFFAYTRVRISGKGRVLIGSGCSAYINAFDHLTITTLTEEALVTIGQGCSLGGATIRGANRIQVGNRVMMAACLIQDVPFFSHKETREEAMERQHGQFISIGDSVWLSSRSIVLNGSSLGNRSVLAVGAVLFGSSVVERCLVLGNPACRPLPIGGLLQLKAAPR